MSEWIAVVDPLPVYRRGIMAILELAGGEPETPEDVLAWASRRVLRVVFLTLASERDWDLLARLRQCSVEPLVVAVLSDTSVATYVRAISAGAVAAIPRDAKPDQVQRAFQEALRGVSVLPTTVLRALTEPVRPTVDSEDEPPARRQQSLAPHEIAWLRSLANGATVAQLARQAGYSERAMFRLLRQVYARLQVRNRTEALLHARQQGWL